MQQTHKRLKQSSRVEHTAWQNVINEAAPKACQWQWNISENRGSLWLNIDVKHSLSLTLPLSVSISDCCSFGRADALSSNCDNLVPHKWHNKCWAYDEMCEVQQPIHDARPPPPATAPTLCPLPFDGRCRKWFLTQLLQSAELNSPSAASRAIMRNSAASAMRKLLQ